MRKQMCVTAFVAGLSCAVCTISAAQTVADPVTNAFRDYKAAQERRDFPEAEAAAKRALAASEARDGDKGTTAILAMNLALAELDLGHKEEAIAPARRALDLARNGAQGVDQLTLRLMLGEAELSTVPTADEQDLAAALQSAEGRHDLDAYIYPAAVALTAAAQKMKHYETMLDAARAAEQHVAGSGMEIPLAQGRALISQGLALVSLHKDQDADKVLAHAIDLLEPLAPEAADDSETFGELSLAQAIVVQAAERARQTSEGNHLHPEHERAERAGLKGKPPLCSAYLAPTPLPQYPADMQSGFNVGAVVLRANVDAQGDVTSVRALAIFPESSFRQSVLDPKIRWTYKPTKPSPGCRVETTDKIFTVRFALQ